jgi:hypothetical protein
MWQTVGGISPRSVSTSAGEAGTGFAVVADEVRNLAQRLCAQAAKDTASLIKESIVESKDGKVKVDHVAGARALPQIATPPFMSQLHSVGCAT